MTINNQRNFWGVMTIVFALHLAVIGAHAIVPRSEHPRPDLERENWMTLNGDWQFENDVNADGEARGLTYGTNLSEKIVVPFCPESKLSGLGLGNTKKLKNEKAAKQGLAS